jgi:hypothetical protein
MLRRGFALHCANVAPPCLLSFTRAAGYRQASKEEWISRASDLEPTAVPVYVIPDAITETEEAAILRFTDTIFAPLDFAAGHYDNLIERYKELYRNWATLNEETIAATTGDRDGAVATCQALRRVRDVAQEYVPHVPLQERVHFLQLEPQGYIRAHADEQRNSSAVVAGLTLASGRVMTLTHPDRPGPQIDMLLAPRSLYILAGAARNDWHHSVDAEGPAPQPPAPGSIVRFEGRDSGLRRERRTAVIFRGCSPMELFMSRMADKKKAGR